MEKLVMRSAKSRVKIMGTLVSISGALIVTLYKGPSVGSLSAESSSSSLSKILATRESHWVLGGLFLATASFSVSLWNTSQVTQKVKPSQKLLSKGEDAWSFCCNDFSGSKILKEYPSELIIVAFCCLFGPSQCSVITWIAERDNPDAWKLKPDIELISVI